MKPNSPKRTGMKILAVLALILGVLSTGWMIALVNQWLLPWSTLKVFVPKSYFTPTTDHDKRI